MSGLKTLHSLLSISAKLLDKAAKEVKENEVEPVRENIEKIAYVLGEIFDIKRSIYLTNPEFKPRYLNEDSECSKANIKLTQVMIQAGELEESGLLNEAIAVFQKYIDEECSVEHIAIADSEMKRLLQE